MVIIGLLLIAVAAAATIGVLVGDQPEFDISILGRQIDNLTPALVFLIGAAAMLLLLLGLMLLMSSTRRRVVRRREVRTQRRSARDLERENTELHDRNANLEERLSTPGTDSRGGAATTRQAPEVEPGRHAADEEHLTDRGHRSGEERITGDSGTTPRAERR